MPARAEIQTCGDNHPQRPAPQAGSRCVVKVSGRTVVSAFAPTPCRTQPAMPKASGRQWFRFSLHTSAFQSAQCLCHVFPAEKNSPANHDAGNFSRPPPIVDRSTRDGQPSAQFRFVNEGRQLCVSSSGVWCCFCLRHLHAPIESRMR